MLLNRQSIDFHSAEIEMRCFCDIYFCFRFVVMLYFFIIINLITFATFALDKWKAVKHKRRISEFSLLSLSFIGGTLGAVLGMLILRHKVSKKSFLWKIGFIIFFQILLGFLYQFVLSSFRMC
ncbi:DUF1294 domain-containing protein [Chryseobacterium sp. Hurlbut01]|uniref:DUF1294 domain-containing protein n=1 Tax=Chryseobacterium sp. Hurlbut01 TaxID=1681828 RepID=UPI002934542E|nr:DUF1294 domain-containing protein [Chryseobacterium sp. Hurlbut01]